MGAFLIVLVALLGCSYFLWIGLTMTADPRRWKSDPRMLKGLLSHLDPDHQADRRQIMALGAVFSLSAVTILLVVMRAVISAISGSAGE